MKRLDSMKPICGISICNPVDVEEAYVNDMVDYAIEKGYDHIQFIGPIHHPVKGNIDGMTLYKKYAQFNNEKDLGYVELSTRVLNAACEKAYAAGIRTFVWHHELELPSGFKEAFPNTLNRYDDIEVTSWEVQDFLEHKILDFFEQYPKMDGIILTLHETKVPLLKLKDQKLGKVERVKYVTKILYDTCEKLGKQLIVRPFASIEEDYIMMTKAYEEISTDMVIMDKWTQFDWSLTLPHNAFFEKIKKNPLLVEGDIFGEYFGKGRLPLMLKQHIMDKYAYCEGFGPAGYCSRIDRAGEIPFGTLNEVNLEIMHACLYGENVDTAIDKFYTKRFGETVGQKVRKLMEPTEEILRKTMYMTGIFFSELSLFPRLNHCKNHFYFEMMKDECKIASDEWFIPKGWERGTIDDILSEKTEAKKWAQEIYEDALKLKDEVSEDDFEEIRIMFGNLAICADVWDVLAAVFYNYTKYFEKKDQVYEQKLFASLEKLIILDEKGRKEIGDRFYCILGNPSGVGDETGHYDYIPKFVDEVKASFVCEKEARAYMENKAGLVDFVICGSGFEGHSIQKEVNFSDTLISHGKLCRIAGSLRGMDWCTVNGHGWFSYLLKVETGKENIIRICCGSNTDELDMQITLNGEVTEMNGACPDMKVIELTYCPKADESDVRIRFDRIAGNTPHIYSIEVLA